MPQSMISTLQTLQPLYHAGSLNAAFVAGELHISERHAYRLLRSLPSHETRPAHNRLSSEVRHYILAMREEYPSRNCQWIAECTADRFARSISQPTVWRILREAGLLEKSRPERKVRSRFEAEASSDLVQMDTTWGYWWGSRKICLILILDDFSRYILHAKWVEHDTAAENMRLIKELVKMYGTPKVLYTDNASFFKTIRHGSRFQSYAAEEYETEIGRACREIGMVHVTHKPYQPQGKGKVERIFRFIQERFVPGIADDMTLADINSYFSWWVQRYNETHVNRTTGCTPKERFQPDGFSPLPAERNLADVFCWKYTRKVDSCNEFSLDGVRYRIPSEHCMVAFKVELHVTPGASIRVWHGNEFIGTLPYQSK